MNDKDLRQNPDQFNWNWKVPVNSFKDKEISVPDDGRQRPFYQEFDIAIKDPRRIPEKLLDSNSGAVSEERDIRLKQLFKDKKSNDCSDDGDEDEDSVNDKIVQKKKRKTDKECQRDRSDKSRANNMQEIIEAFLQQQRTFDEEWRQAAEERDQARRLRDQEWRVALNKLEEERMLTEKVWHEREEQRRAQDEARAEKRDQLFSVLISKLFQEQRK